MGRLGSSRYPHVQRRQGRAFHKWPRAGRATGHDGGGAAAQAGTSSGRRVCVGGWGQWRTSESRTTTGRRPRASDPATAVSPKVEPAGPAPQCSCVCVCARARVCVGSAPPARARGQCLFLTRIGRQRAQDGAGVTRTCILAAAVRHQRASLPAPARARMPAARPRTVARGPSAPRCQPPPQPTPRCQPGYRPRAGWPVSLAAG